MTNSPTKNGDFISCNGLYIVRNGLIMCFEWVFMSLPTKNRV